MGNYGNVYSNIDVELVSTTNSNVKQFEQSKGQLLHTDRGYFFAFSNNAYIPLRVSSGTIKDDVANINTAHSSYTFANTDLTKNLENFFNGAYERSFAQNKESIDQRLNRIEACNEAYQTLYYLNKNMYSIQDPIQKTGYDGFVNACETLINGEPNIPDSFVKKYQEIKNFVEQRSFGLYDRAENKTEIFANHVKLNPDSYKELLQTAINTRDRIGERDSYRQNRTDFDR